MMTIRTRRMAKTLGGVAVAAGLLPGVVQAADLPARFRPALAPPPAPVFTWTGVYAGVNAGGGFSTGTAFNGFLGTTGGKARGVAGGGQIGYNYQISPMFVVGIENDFQASGISTGSGSNPYVRLPFFGSGRARAGLALMDSQLLVYGTAGLAFGQVHDANLSALRFGWTAGGGVEYALSQQWSLKVEGLYTDLSKGSGSNVFGNRHAQFVSGRVGLNYHFDLLRPSRIADGY